MRFFLRQSHALSSIRCAVGSQAGRIGFEFAVRYTRAASEHSPAATPPYASLAKMRVKWKSMWLLNLFGIVVRVTEHNIGIGRCLASDCPLRLFFFVFYLASLASPPLLKYQFVGLKPP